MESQTPESLIFYGERIGLNDSSREKYKKLNLRSLKELKDHPFKDKEEILTSHIKSQTIEVSGNPGKVIKSWLGYKSKASVNLLKANLLRTFHYTEKTKRRKHLNEESH